MADSAWHLSPARERIIVIAFLLWLVLLVVAWPLALLALIAYPLIWLISLPLRLIGISVSAIFDLLGAILRLPGRVLRGPRG